MFIVRLLSDSRPLHDRPLPIAAYDTVYLVVQDLQALSPVEFEIRMFGISSLSSDPTCFLGIIALLRMQWLRRSWK